jgi:hypothetical protein
MHTVAHRRPNGSTRCSFYQDIVLRDQKQPVVGHGSNFPGGSVQVTLALPGPDHGLVACATFKPTSPATRTAR